MTTKYILILIVLLSITFGLRSQTALISGHLPATFLTNAEVEIHIINLNQQDTIKRIPDASGLYEYNAPIGNDYKISAKLVGGARFNDFLNGVSTIDQVLILRHIIEIKTFAIPEKIIAADVNLDGIVTSSDLVLMRRLLLGINQDFGHSNSWFIRPTSNPIVNSYDIINLQADMTGLDFITIKLGDVSGNAIIE